MYFIGVNILGQIVHATKLEPYVQVNAQFYQLYEQAGITMIEVMESVYESLKNNIPSMDVYYDPATNDFINIPLQPSIYHTWNWVSKTWVLNLDRLKYAISTALSSKFTSESVSPVTFEGAQFDADGLARSRIDATIARYLRVGTLPAGFIGWMDYDNILRFTTETPEDTIAKLGAIATLIEDREQALIKKHWQVKEAVRNTADEFLIALDVDALWNSM